ncbi:MULTISPECIES: hypothetical protein [Streptomyces]|uniref:Uncharacterized protein n=1 Tax=Streptomyces celluloflavus TaxID=58344 RepID=A0ABW7RJ36_9ACTN|nr:MULTISPECIES: hypothetical protein [Streptomyces]MYU53517.1 hypothetical protein [Streptomyces sp. SID7805]WSK11364.1 hypothetical protein OG717_06025 [Streptomyces celluloflavus]
MTHRFSLVLNREVTEQEIAALKAASCADISFAADTLPTDAEIPVSRLEFEDAVTPTLAEAIEAGFETVKVIPELSIPGLSVPAQPAAAQDGTADREATKETAEATS